MSEKRPASGSELGFGTRAVHAGLTPDPTYRSVIPAIHQTSTYAQPSPGQFVEDFDYSRSANPTRFALENALGALEGGRAVTFSSGLAAEHGLFTVVAGAGDHVVLPIDLYGGTYRLVDKVLTRWGLNYTMVDQTDLAALTAAIRPETKLIWVETPTNPRLDVVDIAAVVAVAAAAPARAAAAASAGTAGAAATAAPAPAPAPAPAAAPAPAPAPAPAAAPAAARTACASRPLVAVDNTFATPVNQQPLALGADFVVHSTTKYLGGHSDVVGGVVVTRSDAWYEQLRFVQNSIGAVPGPFDCFLVHRGIRTLHLRMAAHAASAQAVVAFLGSVPDAHDIRWPGFSGMVSFRHPDAAAIVTRTTLFTLAESLGGVESLIELPQAMTHQSVEGSDAAVPADLVRLSCGIEDPVDLVADLRAAIA